MKCTICRQNEAVYQWKNILVNGRKDQRIAGLKSAGMCSKCQIQLGVKHQFALASWRIVILPHLGIFAAIILFIKFYMDLHNGSVKMNEECIPVFGSLLAGLIAMICVSRFAPRIYARKHPERVALVAEYSKNYYSNYTYNFVLVPVGDGLYKNKKDFDKHNPGLSNEMKTKIYEELIQTGKWKDLPPASEQPSVPGGLTESRVEIPDASSPDFLSACVDRLLQLYRQHPGGFLTGQAFSVREVGEKLNEAGGMDLMLEAHSLFAAQNPRMARNLEMVWDHIGNWQG